ncbi:MAG: sigma-54 dependent transcriptional regulator [Geobacteraceae bacterium]|nr:sigma-54 dependent transcriptional regulator [Geobacteraceae bacterium]
MKNAKILIVEDDPLLGESLEEALERKGYAPRLVATGVAALEAVAEESFDILLQDVRLPDADGLQVLQQVLAREPQCMALVMTANATIETAVEAMKKGAFDFVTKPFPVDVLFLKLERLLEFSLLEKQVAVSAGDERGLERVIGRSPAIRETKKKIHAVAPAASTVLLLGETGTGKELLAEALHALSPRRGGPFVSVNCAAIPEPLMESEFFGVERGAYTDAKRTRNGHLEAAGGGTLFLDEIGELPLPMQGKLLRVLEERKIRRVGGTTPRPLDFRLVCATSRDLEQMVEDKLFREDLFYRINVVPVVVPPLRERREDIPLLVACFLKKFNSRSGACKIRFSREALETFSRYQYPGNVRELKNIIERITIFHAGKTILDSHLPPEMTLANPYLGKQFEEYTVGKPLKDALAEFEQRYIEKVVQGAKGNKSLSARILGLSRKGLWGKLKKPD